MAEELKWRYTDAYKFKEALVDIEQTPVFDSFVNIMTKEVTERTDGLFITAMQQAHIDPDLTIKQAKLIQKLQKELANRMLGDLGIDFRRTLKEKIERIRSLNEELTDELASFDELLDINPVNYLVPFGGEENDEET